MKITHFAVFGERCSGTNHAVSWIEKNTGLIHRGDCGWKHGPMEMETLRRSPETLVVLVTRNLPDWLRSLHLKPHHLSPAMRGLSFERFIRRRVETIWDHQMGILPGSAKFGTLMESEMPNGKPYANVIRMRRHKHKRWLEQLGQLPAALHLRHEDLMDRPLPALHRALEAAALPPRDELIPVTSYKGRSGEKEYAPRCYAPIAPEAMEHILTQVDWEMETRLGYDTRADLQAACFVAETPDFGILRAAVAGQAESLAMLDAIERRMRVQEDRLRHAELLAEGQRGYLKTLFHAMARSRPWIHRWLQRRRQGR